MEEDLGRVAGVAFPAARARRERRLRLFEVDLHGATGLLARQADETVGEVRDDGRGRVGACVDVDADCVVCLGGFGVVGEVEEGEVCCFGEA